MTESRFELNELDLFEDYDIRMNRNYTSLILSSQETVDSQKDHTKAVPTKRIKTLPTMDYLTKYSETLASAPNLLPPGCRYLEKDRSGGAVIVIEEPPQFRTVALDLNFDMMFQEIKSRNLLEEYGIPENWLTNGRASASSNSYYQLNLAFPYVIFILYIDRRYQVTAGYPFLRINQMIGLSDYLLKIPLSNINDSQRICFGSRLNNEAFDSFSNAAKHAVDVFWTSIFNTDYTYNVQAYSEIAGISNYLEWQHMSRIDPMFIYNVDWIKVDENIRYYIDRLKGAENSSDGNQMYDNFFNSFTKPAIIGESIEGRIRKKVSSIYYDIASGIYLSDIIRFEVGDSFTSESGKTYHVISYIGKRGGEPKYVRLSKDEKLFNFKLTSKAIQYLKERVEAERYIPSIKLKNNLEIKADDIISYMTSSGVKVYKKVYYIRNSMDGRVEIRIGNQYYIAQNFPQDIEKYDTTNPTLHDMKLKKGDKYIYARNSGETGSMINFIESCIYDSIDVGGNNNIIMKFRSTDQHREGRMISINLTQTEKEGYTRKIYPQADQDGPVCDYPSLVSAGRTLKSFISYDPETGNEILGTVHKMPQGYLLYTDTENSRAKANRIKYLIKNDKTFSVDTPFGHIKFDIGDLVVAANWKDPLSVLNIKRIEGFKYEHTESGRYIYFVLMDKNGNLSQEMVVFNEIFRAGYIRKIVTKFDELESGTKIIAETGGIANFPKKDVNIIIGIIIDSHEPLVLCSNGCTLWYQDVMENFKQIPMGSDEWNEKEHAPLDPKKIKFQAGDIVIPAYAESGKEMGYLMVQNRESRSLKYIPMTQYTNNQTYNTFAADKSFQDECLLDSIPNPRITKAQQDKVGYVPGYFNFHGGVWGAEDSALLYVNDQRSFLNVPDSDK